MDLSHVHYKLTQGGIMRSKAWYQKVVDIYNNPWIYTGDMPKTPKHIVFDYDGIARVCMEHVMHEIDSNKTHVLLYCEECGLKEVFCKKTGKQVPNKDW